MGKKYWIGRELDAVKMAEAATSSQAKLAHYDLAGRYSISAAQSVPMHAIERVATPRIARRAKHSTTSGLYAKLGPRAVHQTVKTCRDNARFDTAEAARMLSADARLSYEHSAASWTSQGNILERLEARHDAHLSVAASPETEG